MSAPLLGEWRAGWGGVVWKDERTERKETWNQFASDPGVRGIPEMMPLKRASSRGAEPPLVLRQRHEGEKKKRGVATPRNVRHAGSQTQPLH